MSDKISGQRPPATSESPQAVLLKSGDKLLGLKMIFAPPLITARDKLRVLADSLLSHTQTQKAGAKRAMRTIYGLQMNTSNNANVKNTADAVLYHIKQNRAVDKNAFNDLMLMGRLNFLQQASDGTRPATGRHGASMDLHAKAALKSLLANAGAPPQIANTIMDFIRNPQQAISNATQRERSKDGADPLSTFRLAIGHLAAAANDLDKNDLLKKPLLDLAFQMQAQLGGSLASQLKNQLAE